MFKFLKIAKVNPSESEDVVAPENKIKNAHFHKLDLSEIKLALRTDLTVGLNGKVAKIILDETGKNEIITSNSAFMNKLFQNFFGGFMALLWGAIILSILLYRPLGSGEDMSSLIQGIVIFIIILISGFASSYQDFSTLKAMNSFKNLSANKAKVIRDGIKSKIPNNELVVGDVVILNNGHRVPADCRVIEADNLKLDKSMLTGESDPINVTTAKCLGNQYSYTEAPNMAFMTSLIVSGKGKAVVVATGKDTLISSISKMTDSKDSKKLTMLQRELNRFSIIILVSAFVFLVIVVIIWAAWLRNIDDSFDFRYLMNITISFVIAFLPLGLPIAMTLALILDSRKMRQNQILVKNLTAVETLSSVNVIASDKTGTLTQNKMYVAGLTCGTSSVDIDACFCDSTIYIGEMMGIRQLLAASFICNNAKVNRDVRKGNATDIALLSFSKANINTLDLKGGYKILYELKFNSKNKYHMTIIEPKNKPSHEEIFGKSKSDHLIIVKGAFDILIKRCTTTINPDGTERELDQNEIENLTVLQDYWCSIGRRCILVCKRKLSENEVESNAGQYEQFFNQKCHDLCVLGLFSLVDPPKEGMYDVIKTCREAGIRILMITGDFSITATSISEQVGIYTKGRQLDTLITLRYSDINRNREKYFSMSSKVPDKFINSTKIRLNGSISLTGKDLDLMNKNEWDLVCNYYEEIIISRTTPEHKLKVIKEFQDYGYIIGMTGDGLNDAPALKSANIGIAMGAGNEVAIEASHIVLLDNSFAYMPKAIENGRLVFENLRKVILFLMPACLFTEIVAAIVNVILGTPITLSPYEMIIICVITDVLPSLSLIFEKGEYNLMKKPPRTPEEHLVSWQLLFHGFFLVGIFVSLFSLLVFFWCLNEIGGFTPSDVFFSFTNWQDGYKGFTGDQLSMFLIQAQSSSFVSIIIMQIFGNLFSMRTRYRSLYSTFPTRKKHRNLYLFMSAFITVIITVVIIYVPFMNQFLQTAPVSFRYILISLGFSAFLILFDEARKFLIKKKLYPKYLAW